MNKWRKRIRAACDGVAIGFVAVGLSVGAHDMWNLASGRLEVNKSSFDLASYAPIVEDIEIVDPEYSAEEIIQIAHQTAKRYGVEPYLIQSIIMVESRFNPQAVSHKGAKGVMQLMPSTASAMGVENPNDIHQNIDGGVRYFKKLLRRYRGNVWLALAAYNAGPRKVKKYRGIPPYRETRKYVRQVISQYRQLKKTQDI